MKDSLDLSSATLYLANPRGFCAGVERAIQMVERALEEIGSPIYVKHEVVHNQFVVENLKKKGAIFIEDLCDVPAGATLIFSAHGVSQAVRNEAKVRGFTLFDATCPLVQKVHAEVIRYDKQGIECILIGHKGHPEVEGTMGQYHNPEGGMYLIETEQDIENLKVKNPEKLAYMTQTTLSVDDTSKIIEKLRAKFPAIQGAKKEDICYATQNRQDAVKTLANSCDVVLVVGSITSSNSNRLRELSERMGVPAYLIDKAAEIQDAWLIGKKNIGLTAGASAPEVLVQEVINHLKNKGLEQVRSLEGREENITFALPRELRRSTSF
jgi:4-hydroxy-3-methylbut-2-enyl diphosphate reductase